MCVTEITSIITAGASTAALITVFIAWFKYLEDKKNPDINKKRFYWDFFIPEYLDAAMTIDDKIITLKDARQKIKRDYKDCSFNGYKLFAEKSCDETAETFENKFAHRLSFALNRIGQAAFIGDLPLNYIFPISAKMILEDWEKAKALIHNNIADEPKNKGNGTEKYCALNYTRKFAYWIACTSCLYLIKHAIKYQKKEEADKNISIFLKQLNLNNYNENDDLNIKIKYIISEIKGLHESDKDILGKLTEDYVKTLKNLTTNLTNQHEQKRTIFSRRKTIMNW